MIFSTKDRTPVLTPAIRTELHPYLAVVLRDNDCPALKVGGVEDHVHLFFGLSRTHTVAKTVEIALQGGLARLGHIPSPLGWAEGTRAVGAESPTPRFAALHRAIQREL